MAIAIMDIYIMQEAVHISIPPEKIFHFFEIGITNTFVLSLLASAGIFLFFFLCFKKTSEIPCKLQNIGEWILETIYNFIDSIVQDRKKTEEILPIASTLFILILLCNLLEILPGLGVFSFLRSPSSDLNFTFALSIFSVLFINFAAMRKLGFFRYSKRFFNFKNPILFFVGILEAIGEITKGLSLAIRLFGNLFAGEVLLIVVFYLFAYLVPLPFLGLEILVGFIQALIFSSLIIIFYVTALEEGETDNKANSKAV